MKSIEILVSDVLRELNIVYQSQLDRFSTLKWLSKHAELYDRRMEFSTFCMSCNRFLNIYSELNYLHSYLEYNRVCEIEILSIEHQYSRDNQMLIDWLIKNEDFGLQLELFMVNTCFQYTEKTINGYIPLIGEPTIWIKAGDYLPIVSFLNLFSTNYWKTIESYAAKHAKGNNHHSRELYYGNVTRSLKEYVQSCIQDASRDLPPD